ncbi:glycoside hydrolase family 73 protein [Bombilactobacillus thymidiniphilus]|uniref:Glycoside hydrolase family 73 protein n=1 Tax=Bombilactobacillus thymidiniphilus TaxID=2923363 RepID=A0ABY4PC36_9LACO|nr:glycoside hydrolase family 73 protein [Bombilactobacillus thymidiniphilus]UQS83228.1 glycoside hydrolase family 73 protein [Bombilactobacillus thymidiniphilus]
MAKRLRFKKFKKNPGRSLLTVGACTVVLVVLLTIVSLLRPTADHQTKSVTVTNQYNQKNEFIKQIAPAAMKYGNQYGVFPSITIAQAILESDWGKSQLAADYHNLFGVKSDGGDQYVSLQTKEYVNGDWQTVSAQFQIYNSFDASIADHDKLLAYGTSWNTHQYKHVLASSNYVEAAQNLQVDGYATDPDYTDKIISLIEKYNLYQYDTK